MPTVGCFSNYLEEVVLLHVFNKAALSQPDIFVGLCTASPGDAGIGSNCNEVPHENSYERTAAPYWTLSLFESAAYNDVAVIFDTATGDGWGTVTHFVLLDAETYGTGNMLVYGALVGAPIEILAGSTPEFVIGELDILLE